MVMLNQDILLSNSPFHLVTKRNYQWTTITWW